MTDMEDNPTIECPFCKEINFDRLGLWAHISIHGCTEFNKAGDAYSKDSRARIERLNTAKKAQ